MPEVTLRQRFRHDLLKSLTFSVLDHRQMNGHALKPLKTPLPPYIYIPYPYNPIFRPPPTLHRSHRRIVGRSRDHFHIRLIYEELGASAPSTAFARASTRTYWIRIPYVTGCPDIYLLYRTRRRYLNCEHLSNDGRHNEIRVLQRCRTAKITRTNWIA